MKFKIFISSVQKEFKDERKTLKDYIHGDALLSRFFEIFLFEDLPASDRHPNQAYLDGVKKSDIYFGLFGNEYGVIDKKGASPTHKEFLLAKQLGKPRFIFVKGNHDSSRNPKMEGLIRSAGKQVIRRRFQSASELISLVYVSLVDFLAVKDLLRFGPFDAAVCKDATLKDLSTEKIRRFVRAARAARGFPLTESAPDKEILEHLNLLKKGKPTNAAILLFGKEPQRFLISSEVKCAHFHGTQVHKPIPSYQVYKGTAFEVTDQALNFVLSKIDLAVGTRAKSVQAPVEYELPPDVVREAIVNAVAHRDYTSNGSVQVMLFSDRLEVCNPGALPPSLTLDKLRKPHSSVPANPLLAESLYLAKYIERMGTGTRDMIQDCRNAGLLEPDFSLTDGFVTTVYRKPGRAFEAVGGGRESKLSTQSPTQSPTQSIDPVFRLLDALQHGGRTAGDLRAILKIRHRPTFRANYLHPALREKLIEYTIPDKPNSRLQKYRLTKKGAAYLKKGKA
jgi:predicted HTH transcriptional regulator